MLLEQALRMQSIEARKGFVEFEGEVIGIVGLVVEKLGKTWEVEDVTMW